MLMPKRVKWRKQQRGRRKGMASRGANISFGEYGLQALEPGWTDGAPSLTSTNGSGGRSSISGNGISPSYIVCVSTKEQISCGFKSPTDRKLHCATAGPSSKGPCVLPCNECSMSPEFGKVCFDDGTIGGGLSNSGDAVFLINPALHDTIARADTLFQG